MESRTKLVAFFALGLTSACGDPGESKPPRFALDELSDQELLNTISFGRLRHDKEGEGRWDCVATSHTGSCKQPEPATLPSDNPGYFYLYSDAGLGARICRETGDCVDAQVLRGDAGVWIQAQLGSETARSAEKIYLESPRGEGLFGTYFTHRVAYIEDQRFAVYWKGRVSIDQRSLGVALQTHGRWSLDPIVVNFDQAVLCESLNPRLVAEGGQQLAFSVQTQCEDPAGSSRGPRVSSWVKFIPDRRWPDVAYSVSFPGLRGVSGFASETPLTGKHRVEPWLSSAESLDFEQGGGASWTSLLGAGLGCRLVPAVNDENGPVIVPSSGLGLMACSWEDLLGVDLARAQLAIPAGATQLLFDMAAMDVPGDSTERSALQRLEIKARYDASGASSVLEASEVVAPSEKPSGWSGWHEVKLDLNPGSSMIELSLGLHSCLPQAAGCGSRSTVALDHFRFE